MKKSLAITALVLGILLSGCDNGKAPPAPGSTTSVEQVTPKSDPLAGKYTPLKTPLPTEELAATKPYLVEFFWFGCPHCYSLEPLAKAFKQSHPEVQYLMIPAAPNQRWEIEARIYYAMQSLGIGDSHFDRVFNLYAAKRNEKRYPTLDEVAGLFSDANIDKATLEASMNSQHVSEQIQRSKRLFDQAELTGVPSLIINGKYLLELSKLDSEQFAADFMQTILTLGKQ